MLQCRNPALARLADRDFGALAVAKAPDAGAVHVGRRLGEGNSELVAAAVQSVEILIAEAELHASGGILIGGRVQREARLAGCELSPEGRGELELEPERVAV